MRCAQTICIWLAAAIAATLIARSGHAQASGGDGRPTDTTFRVIRLSGKGVVTVDTAGYEWYYDFNRDSWVLGRPDPDEESFPGRTVDIWAGEAPVEERCTEEIWIKPFETKPVTVGYDEFVDGDITAWGRVTIKGWVIGDVESLSKRVLITETGLVEGNVRAPNVVVRDGGVVLGRITEDVSRLDFDLRSPFSAVGIIVTASFTAFMLLFAMLMITAAPRHVDNYCGCIEKGKIKTFFLGLLFWLLMPPLLVLVIVTIVGAFVVWVVPLAYFVAASMGMIALGTMIGRTFTRRVMGSEKNRLFHALLGILLVMGLWFIAATLLGSGDGVFEGLGILFLVIAILITSFPVASGVGAAFLTRFGFRQYVDWKDRIEPDSEPPAPAPPPLHQDQFPVVPSDGIPTTDET